MRMTIVFVLLLTVAGCDWLKDEFEVITLVQLNEMKCEWQDPKASKWFYVGTKDGYHQLVHRDLPGDKHYQIQVSEFKIDKQAYPSSNEANWVKMPWGALYDACKK